jgi:uncharacterized delta-60 repeat protein
MKKVLFALLITLNVFSQEGTIDPTFNPNDLGYRFGDGVDNYVRAACKQADGKIIIGGDNFNNIPSTIARYNVDGTLDQTFNIGSGPDGTVFSLDIQTDGKILVGGQFYNFNGETYWGIVRLNTDGSVDNTFNANLNGSVIKIKILNDGKILIGGAFTTVDGVTSNRLAKLNNDGSLDTNFNIGTGFNSSVLSIKEQPDQKILIGGAFTIFNSSTQNRITRLNSDGSSDNTFISGTGFNSSVWDIDLQNNKIIAIGNFNTYNSTSSNKIARLNSSGTIDNSFNIGTGFDNNCFTVSVLNDDSILVGGAFNNFNGVERNLILKLNSDGLLDTSFNLGNITVDGIVTIPLQVKTILPLNNNELLIGGYFLHFNSIYRNGVMTIENNGTITEFNNGSGLNGSGAVTRKLLKTYDDKYIILGGFVKYNGQTNKNIVKVNNDGSIDTSFNSGSGTDFIIYDADFQSDNKIIIVGGFTKYNNISKNYICRLNPDGTLDTTFSIGTGFNNNVFKTKVLTDDKILVLGNFTSYNGTAVNKLVRLNSDGTLDTTFNIGTVVGLINSFEVDSNNKILVSGNFNNFNGFNTFTLVRLNSDGSVDTSLFIEYQPDSTITAIKVQDDGKILVGGYFTNFNNSNSSKLVRLNSNGSVDGSFNIGTGFNFSGSGYINNITILPNNKIIVSGIFDSFNSTSIRNFLRLESNGTLDATFNSGFELDNNISIYEILVDGGKLLIGGSFTKYNNVGKNRIARLNMDSLLNTENFSFQSSILIYPNPSSDILTIELQNGLELQNINFYNTLGQLVKTSNTSTTNVSKLTKGTYYVEVITNQGKVTKTIIVK